MLGADGLLYQTHADLIAVGHELNPAITRFEDSCFTGVCLPLDVPRLSCHPER